MWYFSFNFKFRKQFFILDPKPAKFFSNHENLFSTCEKSLFYCLLERLIIIIDTQKLFFKSEISASQTSAGVQKSCKLWYEQLRSETSSQLYWRQYIDICAFMGTKWNWICVNISTNKAYSTIRYCKRTWSYVRGIWSGVFCSHSDLSFQIVQTTIAKNEKRAVWRSYSCNWRFFNFIL